MGPFDCNLDTIPREIEHRDAAAAIDTAWGIHWVVSPGGRERTRQEFTSLLSAVQFELTKVVPTDAPVSIFEARHLSRHDTF
jgi:hypothetical protein